MTPMYDPLYAGPLGFVVWLDTHMRRTFERFIGGRGLGQDQIADAWTTFLNHIIDEQWDAEHFKTQHDLENYLYVASFRYANYARMQRSRQGKLVRKRGKEIHKISYISELEHSISQRKQVDMDRWSHNIERRKRPSKPATPGHPVWTAWQLLTHLERDAVQLMELEGYTATEAAKLLGSTTVRVAGYRKRGLHKIRKHLMGEVVNTRRHRTEQPDVSPCGDGLPLDELVNPTASFPTANVYEELVA